MQALAKLGVPKFAAEGVIRQHDSFSSWGDSQLLSLRVVPLCRSDQLIAAEATSLMIDKCAGCRAHAQSDCRRKIGFGIDIATGIGNRRSDGFRSKTHCAGSMVSCGRPALKLWRQLNIVCHEHGGSYP